MKTQQHNLISIGYSSITVILFVLCYEHEWTTIWTLQINLNQKEDTFQNTCYFYFQCRIRIKHKKKYCRPINTNHCYAYAAISCYNCKLNTYQQVRLLQISIIKVTCTCFNQNGILRLRLKSLRSNFKYIPLNKEEHWRSRSNMFWYLDFFSKFRAGNFLIHSYTSLCKMSVR